MPIIQIFFTIFCVICCISITIFFFKYLFLPILLIALGLYLYTQLAGKHFSFQLNKKPFKFHSKNAQQSSKPEEKIIDVDYTEIS